MSDGNIADYVGRTADVSLFQGVAAGRNNSLELALARDGEGGSLITGAAKLAQRFFLEFMTETGTIFGQPNRGCDFMRDVRQGRLRTTGEIEQAFYLAVDQIVDDLVADQEPGIPDDEAFAFVTLYGIVLGDQNLSINIAVNSVAGSSRDVILPISTRIR